MKFRKPSKINLGNPTDTLQFKAILAITRRHLWFQRLLWKRLRAVMAEGRRDEDDDWRARYPDLLERALRHEQRMERMKIARLNWLDTRRLRPKRPSLQIIKGAKK